jgi:hypothetical protein
MQVAHGLYGHQPMKMPYLQLRNESRGEPHAISHENCDYPNLRFSKYLMTINCIYTTARGAHICFQTIVLYGCNFTSGYHINTMRINSFLPNILWNDEACFIHGSVFNVHNSRLWTRNHPQANRERGSSPLQRLGCNRRGNCCEPLSATGQAGCSKLLHRGCLKLCLKAGPHVTFCLPLA